MMASLFLKNTKRVLNELDSISSGEKTEVLNKILSLMDELVARFGALKEAALQAPVAQAMVNKGFTFGQLGRFEDAIAVYDEVVARFGASKEAALQEPVAQAMFNKGVTFGQLGRFEDAIAVYDEVVVRFGVSEEAALQEPVAKAMVNKGVTFGQLGRFEDEIAVCDEVVVRFGASEEAAFQELVAKALFLKGLKLTRLNCFDEALKTAGDFIQSVQLDDSTTEYAIELFVLLAASGKGKEAIDLLADTPASMHLEPLIVGIRLSLGEEVKVAYEIEEMAKDVAQRIKERAEHWKHYRCEDNNQRVMLFIA